MSRNNVLVVSAILIALTVHTAHALEASKGPVRFAFTGYYKNMFSLTDDQGLYRDLGVDGAGPLYGDDYSRTRMHFRLDFGDYVFMEIAEEAYTQVGDTLKTRFLLQRDIADRIASLPPAFRAQAASQAEAMMQFFNGPPGPGTAVDLTLNPIDSSSAAASLRTDRLNLGFQNDWTKIIVGRQAITWGDGMFVSPMDMVSSFSPTEIDKEEKLGVDALAWSFYFPKMWGIDLLAVPTRPESVADAQPAALGRLRGHGGEFDFSFAGGWLFGNAVFGADFAGYVGDATLKGAGIWTMPGRTGENGFGLFELNTQYGFTAWGNPTLAGEVVVSTAGAESKDDYTNLMTDNADFLRAYELGRLYLMGRYYAGLIFTLTPHPLVNLALNALVNCGDGSVFARPQSTFSLTSNLDLILGAQISLGPQGSEFDGIDAGAPIGIIKTPQMAFTYLKLYW